MKGKFEYGTTDKQARKEIQTPATQDIKEFLINQGNQLNTQRNLAELFMDKEKIQGKTLEAVHNMPHIDRIRSQYRKIDYSIESSLDGKLSNDDGRRKLSAKLENQSQAVEIKRDLQDKILMTVFSITDYIFFNLGEDTEAWANMFGKNLGFSQTRFKDKESFRANRQEIRDVLGAYIVSTMHIGASLSLAQIGNDLAPAIGFEIGFGDIIKTKK